MKIATLSIGDELIYGETVDTNASQIAARLYSAGFSVSQHCVVGDSGEAISDALTNLAKTHDILIASGGLGPTSDDLTTAAAAHASSDTLERNEVALEQLRTFLQTRGRELFPANEKQAILPSRARIIPNTTGTACGFTIDIAGCTIHFLPGVPAEMKPMLEESIIPFLVERSGPVRSLRTATLKLFGVSEARLGEILEPVDLPGVTVAYCVDFPIIKLLLRTDTIGSTQADDLLDAARSKVRQLVGAFVVAEEDATLESEVARVLTGKGLTLAVAESCSGGLLSKRLTDIPGSSSFMLAGVVSYSNEAKQKFLGVTSDLLERYGAVSAEVAAAMAEGIRLAAASDLGLAVTGIAGPGGGTTEKPVGTVYLALADKNRTLTRQLRLSGSRAQIREITVCDGLAWLRRHLDGIAHVGKRVRS